MYSKLIARGSELADALPLRWRDRQERYSEKLHTPDTSLCDLFVFFSSRRRHTRLQGDWSSDVCSSDLRAEARLTARPTSRAGAKAGPSDPVVPSGRAIAQRIKGTPGITG